MLLSVHARAVHSVRHQPQRGGRPNRLAPAHPRLNSRARCTCIRASALKELLQAGVVTSVAAMPATVLQFTPYQAAVGGLCLGVAVAGKLLLTGRILGISGIVKGYVTNQITSWRSAFLLGLFGGGYVAHSITPAVFDVLPSTYTLSRAGLGGLLVGLGASLGNGCTSGHGICGLSRLSLRSLAYVMTFMLAGAAAATLTGTAESLNIAPVAASFAKPPDDVWYSGGLLLAAAVLSMTGIAALAERVQDKKPVQLVAEAAAGVFFAFGLVFAGMVRPSKVAGFLSVTFPGWDPSLMFVMGGGILVALPAFQYVLRKSGAAKPVLADAFQLPKATAIDAKLLAGGLLFGAGWGISGMCPGPALVALAAAPSVQVVAYVGAMLAGMWLEGLFSGNKPGNVKPA